MGRPSNTDAFDKWVATGEVESKLAIIQSLSMQGKSIPQIAEAINMSTRALYYLQKKHVPLKKAIEKGRLHVVAMCQNKLMERVNNGDVVAIIYALKVYGGEFFNDRKLDYKNVNANASQSKVQIYLPSSDAGVAKDVKEKE